METSLVERLKKVPQSEEQCQVTLIEPEPRVLCKKGVYSVSQQGNLGIFSLQFLLSDSLLKVGFCNCTLNIQPNYRRMCCRLVCERNLFLLRLFLNYGKVDFLCLSKQQHKCKKTKNKIFKENLRRKNQPPFYILVSPSSK